MGRTGDDYACSSGQICSRACWRTETGRNTAEATHPKANRPFCLHTVSPAISRQTALLLTSGALECFNQAIVGMCSHLCSTAALKHHAVVSHMTGEQICKTHAWAVQQIHTTNRPHQYRWTGGLLPLWAPMIPTTAVYYQTRAASRHSHR